MNSAESSCTGKVPFKSYKLAQVVVKRNPGHGRDGHESREPYHCEHCRQWHIGTNNKVSALALKARRK